MEEINTKELNKLFNISGPDAILMDENDFEIVSVTDLPFTRLPRCKWQTKRCWWNNGVEQTLREECPPGWQKGRLWSKEHKASFKAKVGCSGKYDRTRFKKINNTPRAE